MLSQVVESTFEPWGGKVRQPTRVCGIVCVSVIKQVGFENQQRKRENRR
jgi:hypothetical protein